jgi:hypothetical protein
MLTCQSARTSSTSARRRAGLRAFFIDKGGKGNEIWIDVLAINIVERAMRRSISS